MCLHPLRVAATVGMANPAVGLDRLHGRLAKAGLSPRALANGLFWLLRIK